MTNYKFHINPLVPEVQNIEKSAYLSSVDSGTNGLIGHLPEPARRLKRWMNGSTHNILVRGAEMSKVGFPNHCRIRKKKRSIYLHIYRAGHLGYFFREGPGHRPKGLSQQITTFVQTFSLFKPVPSPFWKTAKSILLFKYLNILVRALITGTDRTRAFSPGSITLV